MFAVGGTVELGLDVDAGRGGQGKAVANMNVAFRCGGEGSGFGVDGSGVAGFDGGMSDFANGLLELRLGEGFGVGQSCIAFESQGVDGFAVRDSWWRPGRWGLLERRRPGWRRVEQMDWRPGLVVAEGWVARRSGRDGLRRRRRFVQ